VVAPRAISLLMLGLAAPVLGACGGGDSNSTSTTATPIIRMSALEGCLRRGADHISRTKVTRTPAELDTLARQAPGGALVVIFDKTSVTPRGLNRATFVLEGSAANAATTVKRYGSVYKALGGNAAGLVAQRANAVIAYQARPSKRQRALVDGCLA
jgi:hypothetical protein